ncbi:MAG: hypothetical protein A2Z34_10540 [Planctomycetes bacterium RBG_16_59_8]|nr:MAG: hypothetical protein A2Z34_10540 [Planctomycetes bacterium RBG_16_59_8]
MIDLDVRDVRFRYEGVEALKGVSLALRSAEIVGLVGPNGSGKSTLLRAIAGLLRPEAGVVLLDGRDIRELRPREVALKLSMLPQETSDGFDFTCHEIVLMGRYPHGRRFHGEEDEDRAVVQRVMEKTDTWSFRDRGIMEISGGERQRVHLARAFAQEPHLLLLDEPTSHLDIHYQTQILEMTARMAVEEQIAVLAVFHDLNLASIYSRSLFMLHEGKIVAAGKPDEVLTRDNIRLVYGVDVVLLPHPRRGVPLIVPE